MKLVGKIPLHEIADGQLVRMKYPPYDVLVTTVDGEPTAIEDSCNHGGASLAAGERSPIRPNCVVCPLHGYVFDLRSGKIIVPQGLCDDQRTFSTTIEGDEVVVWDTFSLTVVT